MKLHPHAAGLFPLLDPRWRRKLFTGGLLLLVAPPFGWPAILGYRKALVAHLFDDLPEALPSWEGRKFRCFREGLKAMGVIFGYYLPLYVALAALALGRGWVPGTAAAIGIGFFLLFPIFSTLSFPVACLHVRFASSPAPMTNADLALLLGAFAVTTFLLPAGFLRVSQTGRYRSAFDLPRALSLIARSPRAYLAAWWYSGLMSLLGHFAIPFSPWGVAWCYLGIVFLFNEILFRRGEAPGSGWLARALADERLAPGGGIGLARITDGAGEPVRILRLWNFSVPLPLLR